MTEILCCYAIEDVCYLEKKKKKEVNFVFTRREIKWKSIPSITWTSRKEKESCPRLHEISICESIISCKKAEENNTKEEFPTKPLQTLYS